MLKQKLKMMKASLKEWHQQHSHNMEGKITEIKNRIYFFDSKGEVNVLLEEEAKELHDLSVNLHSMSRVQNNINWQKSRLKWLQEGDENSKFFHNITSNHRSRNNISMVQVDGVSVEGVQNIRTPVFNHFSNHFKNSAAVRPCVETLPFRKLSFGESGNLTKPFLMEEVKQAVWDCDSFKNPGPDGISFGFI